ncbi:MAG: carbohydrate kinase [Candidatus Omnitrophota bacterium]
MRIDALFLGGTSIDLIQNKSFTASVGGGITNSAIIAAKLGLKTALLSKIGKDPLGDFAIDFLKSRGVNTSGIIRDPDINTPIAIARIDRSGDSRYTFYKNSPKDSIVPLKNAPKGILNACEIFHFGSSFSYQKETSVEALKYVKYLKKRGALISFDPNLRPNSIKDKPEVKNRVLRLLNLSDLAKLSEIDLSYLTGQKDPAKGLKTLKKRLKREVILTLGAKGCAYLDHAGKLIKIPAFKIKTADTIGAGDAFTSGLIYKLIKEGKRDFFANIRRNMIFASAVSALTCAKPGANQGLKDIKQVYSFLDKKKKGG